VNILESIKERLPQLENSSAGRIYNLRGSLLALCLAFLKTPYLLVTKSEGDAEKIREDIEFYATLTGQSGLAGLAGSVGFTACPPPLYFPDADDPDGAARQVEILLNAPKNVPVITTLDVFLKPSAGPDAIRPQTLTIKKGFQSPREDISGILLLMGYRRVALVAQAGEFSLRNYILDIYPPGSADPVRVELFGDEVDSIRVFSADTQRTISRLDEVVLLPATTPEGDLFLHEIFSFTHIFVTEDAERGVADGFGELAFTELSRDPIAGPGGGPGADIAHGAGADIAHGAGASAWEGVKSSAGEGGDSGANASAYARAHASAYTSAGIDAGAIPVAGLGILPQERKSMDDLLCAIHPLAHDGGRVIIVSATKAQAARMHEIFMDGGMIVPVVEAGDIADYTGVMSITVGGLNEGVHLDGFLILTEREIFGDVARIKHHKKTSVGDLIRSMDDISAGDYVVHDDHGIGVFEGLKRESAEGFQADMMVIRYDSDARLYLPIYSIGLVRKYRADEGILPKLDKMGGKTWQKIRRRVKERVRDIAEKLVKHYAGREVIKGFAASPDGPMHREFDNFFPYEETPDQLTAIQDIKRDMESERPMDRLLCGDVGYGKTEVAMRAAFKAVFNGRQAVVLVPTTILCEQHYITFKERFSAFPVKVDYISRFKSAAKNRETLQRVARGEIDIIIGTHGLLRKDVEVPNPGILIIDEEHRFGVLQKERIKELKSAVDCLSLSATPIPRTLQMALSGIWNLSMIETPPEERQAVRTFVSRFDKAILKEAILREFARGGQVFFVHNRIGGIEKIAAMIKELVPEAALAVAHGQMDGHELERIMLAFMTKKINLLVSTSIIGSGIDIPSANTIIINMADKMGLADLYQLRGRVGRSSFKAYAYFFIPGDDLITEEARKRLTAIQELSYLGAGFRLAMKDMEIRGAGNLLGSEQSGHIRAVGLDTYMEMLEEEIAAQRGQPIEKIPEPVIDLRVKALIPEEYVEDVSLRLNFYRRIASAQTDDAVYGLQDEMTDRFGKLPGEVATLFSVMRVKILCRRLRAVTVKQTMKEVQVVFSASDTPVTPEALLGLGEVWGEFKGDVKGAVKVKGGVKVNGEVIKAGGAFGPRVRFLEDGFALQTVSMEAGEVVRELIEALRGLERGIDDKAVRDESDELLSIPGFLEECKEGLREIKRGGGVNLKDLDD
jgi:transcription-repair coupling factor (superfamily II helicase)